MALTYEEAVILWAAKKFSLDVEKIASVSLEHEKGYGAGCSTCGWGADECSITVYVYSKTTRNTKIFTVDLNFATLLGEILAASAGPVPVDEKEKKDARTRLRRAEQELTR